MGTRTGLDILENTKISPYLDSNPGPSSPLPIHYFYKATPAPHFHIVPRLRVSGVIPSPSHMPTWHLEASHCFSYLWSSDSLQAWSVSLWDFSD